MIKYGDKVLIRDQTKLEGTTGLVLKVSSDQVADVLLDKAIIYSAKMENLELIS